MANMTATIVTTMAPPYPVLWRALTISQNINNPIRTAITNHSQLFGVIKNSTQKIIAPINAVTKAEPNELFSDSTKPNPSLRKMVIKSNKKISNNIESIILPTTSCNNILKYHFFLILFNI
jgi:hypothetical protein